MLDEDKAQSVIPDSPAQKMLKKVDRRSFVAVVFGIGLLLIVTVFNVFTAVRLQYIIDKNQEDTLQARDANVDRQEELQGYIKCVLLLRFDTTPEQFATREGASKALDDCAKQVRK